MRKFFGKLALALLPVALYLCFFLAFEPNNYFGLRKTTVSSTPIQRLRAYAENKLDNVIIGDSRLAHFDMSLVEQAARAPFANLAYGGASLAESIDEFYYIYNENPQLKRVVFGVSFYTLNDQYRPVNRMKTLETQLSNPAAYVFNLEYNINALTIFADILRGAPSTDSVETAQWERADYLDEANVPLPYRKDLIAYAASLYSVCAQDLSIPAVTRDAQNKVTNARAVLNALQNAGLHNSKYAVNQTELARLLEMAEFCSANGIALTFVLPPMDDSVLELVCRPLGIDQAMQPVLAALKQSGAAVVDYEWENRPDLHDTQFYDGFHVDVVYGLPQVTQSLFAAVR